MATQNSFTIIRRGDERLLHIAGDPPDGFQGEAAADGFQGEAAADGFQGEAAADGFGLHCPLNAHNADVLRKVLPWTAPVLVGLRKSFGFGDRLGIATPGHLDALGNLRESGFFPVLAQQSMREMARARRSPQQVMDDVTWAVVETGYRDGFGCDADHVKTEEEIDRCIDAGFIGFTLDPGQYVCATADTEDAVALRKHLAELPWDTLQSNPKDHRRLYVTGQTSGDAFSEETYLRAAVKYGPALAQTARLHAHLRGRFGAAPFDLEVSVDETDTPTTPEQHRFIALELHRLGIDFIGLAPRFVGDFYKGVDYVGDVDAFDRDYAMHAAIAEELGPYKLSVHSGSDKLAIYPAVQRRTPDYVHVKTSGTSWLEALRVIATYAPGLFRRILDMAVDGYATNRQSYHLDGRIECIPDVDEGALPTCSTTVTPGRSFMWRSARCSKNTTTRCTLCSPNTPMRTGKASGGISKSIWRRSGRNGMGYLCEQHGEGVRRRQGCGDKSKGTAAKVRKNSESKGKRRK